MDNFKSDIILNCFFSWNSWARWKKIFLTVSIVFIYGHAQEWHYPQLFLQSGFMGKISTHNVAYEALNYDIKMVEIFTFSSLISGKTFVQNNCNL